MEALDLTKAPPRRAREELDGLVNLPRSIDKMRAHLPGGNRGVYNIPGFTAIMLEMIGVTEDQFREAVAQAKTDDDVAAWLRAHANTEKYPEFNERILKRRVADVKARDPEGFAKRYPISLRRTDIEYMIDMLEADDEEMFPAR